jgi:hypothetical protein
MQLATTSALGQSQSIWDQVAHVVRETAVHTVDASVLGN